jgi:transposase-like protein
MRRKDSDEFKQIVLKKVFAGQLVRSVSREFNLKYAPYCRKQRKALKDSNNS